MAKTPQSYERKQRIRATTKRLVHANRHPWLAPVFFLIILAAIIAGACIISTVTQRHIQLDDGTVWVTSQTHGKAARYNVKLREPDTAVSSADKQFDVAQNNGITILSEQSKATSIQPSTISMKDTTATRATNETHVGADTVAFLDTKTGDVWLADSTDIASTTPQHADPNMKLGPGGKISVTHDGAVYGYRPADGKVLRLHDHNDRHAQGVASIGHGGQAQSFTVIGQTPIIASGKSVIWPKGEAAIADSKHSIVLQSAPVDGKQEDWLAAVSENGVFLINLKESRPDPVFLDAGAEGDPAIPVSSQGCVHAAWSKKVNNYVRVCSVQDSTAKFATLASVNKTSQLVFRTNHRQVIVNDVINGNVWNPEDSTDVIKIQWNKIETQNREEEKDHNDDSTQNKRNYNKNCSSQSGQIKAVDDQFGARPGANAIIDVLRNDEQTDCSILRISSVSAPTSNAVHVKPIYDGRYLQLHADANVSGNTTFTYEISDGHGQTSRATVTLAFNKKTNRAPVQIDKPEEIDIEQGATYTGNALSGFADPDGDPLTLVSATIDNTDEANVSTRADGQITFNAGAMNSGRATVKIGVSDGTAITTGTMYFTVRPANTLSASLDPVVKQTVADSETTVDLHQYVHGTSLEPAVLTEVESPNNATTTLHTANMSFSFKARDPGTYYVPYTVTQGTIPTNGLVRVEVQAPTKEHAKPIAANDVALLGSDNTAIVEPLTNDVDPMGGVLSVTQANAGANDGIKLGIVGNKRIYITAIQTPTQPIAITYTVANASGTSDGTIVLQPPALTSASSVPKAKNIKTSVRTNGIVSVDVLDHVSYADGTSVTLNNKLQYDKTTFEGLAFVSGDSVRYQAGKDPGTYPITYTVTDNLGNSASGTISIEVHQKDAKNKPAPTPQDVEGQVAAGQKVSIPITLSGIDKDGDDVQLLGLGNTVPKLGRISEVGANYLVYEAYADSSGTDTFTYSVEDWTGQRAQAQVRVGIFSEGNSSSVYARDDEIRLRPSTTTSVPVVLNDISSDDSELHIDSKLEEQNITGAKVANNMITFTTPSHATTAYINYQVRNKAGLSDRATLTVTVDEHAPIEPPTAYDYRVPATATIDKKSVDVDVSPWIANPSGTMDELTVGVHPSATDHARMKGGKNSTILSIDLTDDARTVPYTVTNTKYKVTSTAFIQVPAYGVFPPTLRPKAPKLEVNAGESITINIADYVRVGAGKTPLIADKNSVSATKAANNDLYVNNKTLKFTAPKHYGGPASITFTATDGQSATQGKVKIVNSAVLTLPITVNGHEIQPPTFNASTLDVVAGEAPLTVDLKSLTHAVNPEDAQSFTYSGGQTSGQIKSTLTDQGTLKVSAPADASVGTTVSIPFSINYDGGSVKAGITARVVASTKPVARINPKQVQIKAGQTQDVNILADAFNPFPDTPLHIVSTTCDDSSRLHVTSNDSGVVTIRAAQDIGTSTNKVLVTLQDATKSKERQVTGTITVAVVDRPSKPQVPPLDGKPQDGAVTLHWEASNPNGSPITDYQVQYNGGEKSCGNTTSCEISGLTNGKTYTFTVRAKNEVGWSDPSNEVTGKPDKAPEPPTNVTISGGKNEATVTWDAPHYEGTAPSEYRVTLSNGESDVVKSTSKTFTIDNGQISDKASFSATVVAKNDVGESKPASSKPTNDVYGEPDDISLQLQQDGERIVGNVTVGNLHNAGCESLSSSRGSGLSCSNGTFSFDIGDDYFTDISVTVSLTTQKAGKKTDTKNIKPLFDIPSPTVTRRERSDNTCKISWQTDGRVSEVAYQFGKGIKRSSGGTGEDTYTLQPWESCPSYSLTALYKGNPGKEITGSIDNPTYKVKPEVRDYNVHVAWGDEPNEVTFNAENDAINCYSKSCTYTLQFDGIGSPYKLTPEQINGQPFTVDGITDDTQWTLKVSIMDEPSYEATTSPSTISGSRPSQSERIFSRFFRAPYPQQQTRSKA